MTIDKAFLESYLKAPVTAFKISEGTKAGDNVAGSLISIKVELQSGETLDLIYKTYSEDEEFKQHTIQFQAFTIENGLYEVIIPRLSACLKRKGLSPEQAEIPVPKHYGGRCDPKLGDEFLLLGDVRPSGYVMKDKHLAYNLEEATLVLKELARLHASSYFWIRYEGEHVFDSDPALKIYRDSKFSFKDSDPVMMIVGGEMFDLEVQSAAKILDHLGHPDLAARVRSKLVAPGKGKAIELVKERSHLTDTVTFPCIIHGDCWSNNILVKYDDGGRPVALKFLDFQQTRRGNIYEDLVYFILTSTTPSFRKEHLATILNSYFDAFSATLAKLDCPLPIGFDRGTLINRFYSLLLGGYAYMAFAIPLQLAEPLTPAAKAEALMKQMELDGGGQAQAMPDPSQMTPEAMLANMIKGLEVRSKVFHAQMLKSPRALDRLLELTKEMAELNVI